jgi:hypothetical protein
MKIACRKPVAAALKAVYRAESAALELEAFEPGSKV